MNVVTGAFSYTGSYIARRLLADGEPVKTLSRRPDPAHPLSREVALAPLRFDDEDALTESLRDAATLYNTYWIRFPRGDVGFDTAVRNTRTLLRAARAANVGRVVHIGVANSSEDSTLPYFRHKAIAERTLRELSLSHAIVRPTLIFERGDILINNIAWALRRFPLFTIPGTGRYRVQPVSALDVADLAVDAARRQDDEAFDAAGPDTFSFEALVALIRGAVGARSRIVHAPPRVAQALANVAGRARGDVMLTRDELEAVTDELLASREPPRGTQRFGDWLAQNAGVLGRRHVSERQRNWGP